ncbi:MAG: SDR family oxidoreductase [Bacteriovorax sp.]|nr:SDR family oxidoreductase [Bacteriovorax sp.]
MKKATQNFSEIIDGKSIFLTGSTGFLAKVFLEKILHIAPNVDKIYLHIRSANFNHALSRLENDVFSSPLFASLYLDMQTENGNQLLQLLRNKVRFVSGDISKPRMGVSNEDYMMLLANVDFVVNSAASTDFMNPLDEAVATNTLSVNNIVEFIKASKKAKLLHVSTCYIHESQKELVPECAPLIPKKAKGRFPSSSIGIVDTQKILSTLDDIIQNINALEFKTKEKKKEALIDAGYNFARSHGWFNVYTFTKWLGESIIQENKNNITCVVVRPSIVESCLYGPTPGWIEGLKVADPLIYGVGINKIPYFPGSHSTILDLVPVDIVSNTMFLGLISIASTEEKSVNIYQACSGGQKPLSLKLITDIVRDSFTTKPLTHRVMVPPMIFWAVTNSLLSLKKFFGHKKRKDSKTTNRMLQMTRIFEPYTNIKCSFDNSEALKIHSKLSERDRLQFPITLEHLNWHHYLQKIHIPGLRKFVVDNRSGIPLNVTSQTMRTEQFQSLKKVA